MNRLYFALLLLLISGEMTMAAPIGDLVVGYVK